MKKLIAVVTLLLAFTITANAQDKKVAATAANTKEKLSSEEAAKKDIAALIATVSITQDLKKDLYTLMIMKHDALSNPKLSASEKEALSKSFERKVLAGLDEVQRKQLMSNPDVLQKIAH